MALQYLVELLKSDVAEWNSTRCLPRPTDFAAVESDELDSCTSRLSGGDLSGARLIGASLAHADLQGANLSNAELNGADLRSATLLDAVLCGVDLSQAILSEVDVKALQNSLQKGQVIETRLSRANLSRANLTRACLQIDLTQSSTAARHRNAKKVTSSFS